jgi:hypothetical protein
MTLNESWKTNEETFNYPLKASTLIGIIPEASRSIEICFRSVNLDKIKRSD